MSSFRNHFPLLLAAVALSCAVVHCGNIAELDITTLVSPLANTTIPAAAMAAAQAPQANSTRAARLMKFLKDPKTLTMKRFRIPPKIRARADQFASPVGPPAPQRMSASYRRAPAPAPPAYISSRPQLLRRAQNGIAATTSQRFAYEGGKNARYSGAKGAVAFNAGKTSVYRPQFAGGQQHPNALAPQALSPLQQQQAQQLLQLQQPQQQQHQQHYNFKASPPFNGKAIMRPVSEQHDAQYPHYPQQPHQQHHQSLQHQQPVQQYPIPPQSAHTVQQYSSAPVAGTYQQSQPQQQHQQQAQQTPYKALFHYERAHEEPVLHPHIKHNHGPERPSYAVYEDGDLPEALAPQQPSQQSPPASNHNYFVSSTEAAAHDTQDYLRFMSSNEYFLPKREPDYRQIDADKDQQTQHQQHYQHPLQQQRQQPQKSNSQSQHHLQYSKSLQNEDFSSSGRGSSASAPASSVLASASASASANYLNTPIQVSQFFYHEDPAPPSSAVVRGSYQAGSNVFVVNSDGNKAVKHIVPSPLPAAITPTTPAVKYPKVHYSNAFGSRTPEPVRFEFTERDAVTSTYTNSPLEHAPYGQQHLRYKAVDVAAPSTPHTPTLGTTLSTASTGGSGGGYGVNSVTADDAEDDEDIHEASSNYGRVPVQQPALGNGSSSLPPPPEQKDNEDYCERICANVQDDDEEIVCGSDGYMYTSEAQMECYASCLRIDVTIQSKGSCSAK